MLENLVSQWLVDPIFSKFERGTLTTILFLGSCLFVLVYAYKCYERKVRIGNHLTGLSVLVLVWWFYYRFIPGCMDNFLSYPVNWIPSVCYVDIFALAGACCIVLKLFRKKRGKEGQYNSNGFIIDTPISKEGEDILDRTHQAKELAERLIKTDTEKEAFTLGIIGNWGDGKSSFMSLMKNHITSTYGKDVIVMDFNPWLYAKGVNFAQTFFNDLRCTLSPLDWDFSHQLKRYSDTLSQIGTPWSHFVSVLLIGTSCKDQRKQYAELCERMRELDKKIVVFVDDIDRLDQEEMTAVFQLVRNTSNFPNMYFVMAYDKKYVINTLQGSFGNYGRAYTEKIFQEEYVLPKITEEQIQNLLCSIWKKGLDRKDYDNIMERDNIKLSSYLLNYRDVKRFFNVLSLSYARKKEKVEIRDFVLYTLLDFRYPQMKQFISDNRNKVLQRDYNKRYLIRDGLNEAEDEDCSGIDIVQHLRKEESQKELGLANDDIPLISRLVFSLWGKERHTTPLSINYQSNINLYLS